MLVLAIFFQVAPIDAGLQVMGIICAIFGLMAVLEGLRVCIMVRRLLAACCTGVTRALLPPGGEEARLV